MNEVNLSQIENMIYMIRGQKVMLDSDLAELYKVETKALNQSVTSKVGRGGKQKFPLVFTENGLVMLSGVLSSTRAVQVNIAIMTKLEDGPNKLFKIVFERLDTIDEQIEPKLSPSRKKIGLQDGLES